MYINPLYLYKCYGNEMRNIRQINANQSNNPFENEFNLVFINTKDWVKDTPGFLIELFKSIIYFMHDIDSWMAKCIK